MWLINTRHDRLISLCVMLMGKSFYKFEVDQQDLSTIFSDLPKVTKVATANTVNIVARKVNKNLKKSITDRYNIPKSALKFGELVSIKRANARANIGKAVILIRKKGRGLIKYGAEQVTKGVRVTVKKSSKIIKGGFIGPLRKGGSEKFARIKATGKKAGKVIRKTKAGTSYEADKTEIMYGPPIADLYTNKAAEVVILQTIDEEFQTELDKQFNKQFEKGGRR